MIARDKAQGEISKAVGLRKAEASSQPECSILDNEPYHLFSDIIHVTCPMDDGQVSLDLCEPILARDAELWFEVRSECRRHP